ncbi:nucleotidyl transferase AbiEii/AbiGii toxin family protein [Xylanimonas sp. McL0601]|uniref:nucleotidyl transferase AbiEii/AbiGii toxin family protein n=1 Tax=Xylanimonas sp. McL0601 TaxID=3414739 RepID=UPI003CEF8146
MIDIAQDLLLAHLVDAEVFDLLVFKGGTALRKTFAGPAGRFSTDLDFSLRHPDADRQRPRRRSSQAWAGVRARLGPRAAHRRHSRARRRSPST